MLLVPVLSAGFASLAGRAICLQAPRPFIASGAPCRAFQKVAEAEVAELLESADGGGSQRVRTCLAIHLPC